MPSKKKKYNARFPAGRIKKIMQSDEEIGKVAQAVPVIISRTLELFVESLLNKTLKITTSRNAKTLSTSHMKQCIMAEQRFDFLRELVKNIPDISIADEAASSYLDDEMQSSPEPQYYPDSDTPYDLSMPSTSTRSATNGNNQRLQQFPLRSNQNGGAKPSTSSPLTSIQNEVTTINEGNNLRIKKTNSSRPLRNLHAAVSQDGANQKYDNEFRTNIMHEVSSLRPDITAMPSVIRNMQTHQEIGKIAYDMNNKESFISAKTTASSFNECENLTYKNAKEQSRQRKAIIQNIAFNNSSVIKHTNTSQDSYPPQKLPRAEPGPAVDRTIIWHPTEPRRQTSSHSEFVKHQNNEESSELSTSNDTIPYPPIPAPIVSIDFCNKPVVKIDYSNLSIPPIKKSGPSIIEPLQRTPTTDNTFNPANNKMNTNLNSEPVINIDLSNIVTNTGGDINSKHVLPNISLGNITSMSSYINSSLAAQINLSNNSKAPINFSRTNSNFMPSSSSSTSDSRMPSTVTTSSPSAAAINNRNSFFELDEDYDNI